MRGNHSTVVPRGVPCSVCPQALPSRLIEGVAFSCSMALATFKATSAAAARCGNMVCYACRSSDERIGSGEAARSTAAVSA